MVVITAISTKSSHNGVVIEYVSWVVLALIAAAGVLVAAAVLSKERENAGRGLSGFLADVRAGLQDIMGRNGKSAARDANIGGRRSRAYQESMSSLDLNEFFIANEHAGEGYMQAEEIIATLERARTVIRTRVPSSWVQAARQPFAVSGHVPVGSNGSKLTQSQHVPQN